MGEKQSSPATPPFCLVDIRNLRIDDTPPLVKYTSTSSYATGSLMNGRRAVLADLGESIPEVPFQFFLVNILPPLRGGINIGNVVEKLQRRKIITRDGLWKSLPSRPALSPSFENATFKSLEEISKSICDAAQIRGTKKTIYFENNPNITPESKMRDSTSRPDGYFILHDRLNGVHWMDFALCAEYKKRNTPKNVDDNVEKVVWGMHHCMREDPRRRFTFGLTIEDTNTRLWFCSRAEIMVTQPFNFMTDHDTFTHFLSFAYAEMHELGWDPTMRLVKDSKRTVQYDGNGAPRYDITVRVSDTKHVVYRTVKVLSDIGANAMQGRGTRVWEARQIVNGEERGDSVALKDSWIDSDRDREGTVFQALRDSNTTKKFQKRLDRHFLTVLCHGDVYVHGEQDHTRDLMTQGVEIPSGCAKLQNSPLPGTSVKRQVHTKSRHGTGDHRTAEEHDDQDLMIPPTPKAHYRIVFKEVCKPLFEITSLALIFKVLSQTVLALGLMHSSGIGDLEYAKKYLNNESMDNKRKHDVRTGTANFIAVEVDNRGYNFTPGPSAWVPKNALDIDSLDRLMDDIAEDPDTELGNIDIEKTVNLLCAEQEGRSRWLETGIERRPACNSST
ncbi:hypothetical protein AcV5_003114 [Taiwanofungus camphoratus]|nr:hypothetical protein AcV5_003114 [Antrodia cinnamomea]